MTEDEWQATATGAAISAARKIAAGNPSLLGAQVGRLADSEWGWIITAAIFAWVQTRCEQAIAEGLEQEQTVRVTGLEPNPCDVAVVSSILPELSTAGIDWALPLSAWSKETMTSFLLLAWQLMTRAEGAARQPQIIRPSKPNWEEGDSIPF